MISNILTNLMENKLDLISQNKYNYQSLIKKIMII